MTTDADETGPIRIQLVHAQPSGYWSAYLSLGRGAAVADALAEAGPMLDAAGIGVDTNCLAVFGRTVETRTPLRDGDRLELLRPLLVSPRDARTSRASTTRKR